VQGKYAMVKKINRVILIILDSVGIGELPDADLYNDRGSNTLVNTAQAVGGLRLPNLEKLGLGNIDRIKGVKEYKDCLASYGKMAEKSPGKDTTVGHWEIAGIISDKPFPTYPQGFPDEVILPFQKAIEKKVLGNKPASGTVIIEELGKEHIETGYPIVYTSADSVFQIATHEQIIPLPILYQMCKQARKILQGEHAVARVIARPFIGQPGAFIRTSNRKDFSLPPTQKTILDFAVQSGFEVIGVGKINDIFAGQGITKNIHAKNNEEVVDQIIKFTKNNYLEKSIIFSNLVDFDMLYGHRNNVRDYAKALEDFDFKLPEIIKNMNQSDILIITADHGCDPTTPSTDHSREYVPLLIYGNAINPGINLGTLNSFADLAATISDILNINHTNWGKSFKNLIFKS